MKPIQLRHRIKYSVSGSVRDEMKCSDVTYVFLELKTDNTSKLNLVNAYRQFLQKEGFTPYTHPWRRG